MKVIQASSIQTFAGDSFPVWECANTMNGLETLCTMLIIGACRGKKSHTVS